ncbi:MAG: hypothetical protein JSS51_13035 [Planctomycetes bacterium]|nr:hypothetical protein [Planctomycetota bacterium]
MRHRAIFCTLTTGIFASPFACAQSCDPARLSDLPSLPPLSTVSALGSWDPDGAGPLASQLIIAGEFGNGIKPFFNHIVAWDGSHLQALGEGLSVAPSAFAMFNGNLVAGGQAVAPVGGTSFGGIGQWNGTAWIPFPGEKILGSVNALRVHNGQLYVGGSFNIPGIAANIVVSDGTSWHALGQGLSAPVTCLEVLNDEIVAGGSFKTSGSTTVNNVARWDGHAWRPLGNGPGGSVASLAAYHGGLYAVSGNSLVSKWDGTQWSSFAPADLTWPVRVLTVHAAGDFLYFGGTFQTLGARPTGSIFSWDGSEWSGMQGGLRQGGSMALVGCMTDLNGELYVGGTLTHAAGTPANGLARWTGNTWRSTGSNWSKYSVQTVRATVDGVYALDSGNNIARWDAPNWVPIPSLPAPFTSLQIFTVQGRLFAVADRSKVFRFDSDFWTPIGDPLPTNVTTLVDYRGSLVAGGTFHNLNGVTYNGVATWNGATWMPVGAGFVNASNGSTGLTSLIVWNNDLYAFGSFTQSGTTDLEGFARWNGSGWIRLDTGGVPNPKLPIEFRRELVTLGNGAFRVWNGQTWRTEGDPFTGQIFDAKVYNGRLIAGGANIGGAPENDLVEWTGSGWQAIPPGPSLTGALPDGTVLSLDSFGGDLHVGGNFLFVGSDPAYNFYRLTACSRCPCDLDSDAAVGDDDFLLFAAAYDTLECGDVAMPAGCPADFNRDGAVNDADFILFITAYDAQLCP